MEHIEQEPSADFVRGFNQGYAIHKHFPDVAEQMAKLLEQQPSDHAKGFIAGHEEYCREQTLYISWKKLPDHYDDLEPFNEKDRDVEPDEPEPET